MELAVVIPTLNEQSSIGSCLESIGTSENVEVIVSDGGSSDRTLEIARRGGARVITGIRGRGQQLNHGADAAAADRLLFLHADCRLPEKWFSPVIEAVDDPDVTLVCFRLRTLPSEPAGSSKLHRWWLRFFDLRSRGLRLPYGDQGFAVRRTVFDRCGGFPDIPLMEDVAFARSCRRFGTLRRLPLEVQTSARRVERKPLRTSLMLTTFPTLFRLGIAPETLARWYGNIR